MFAHSGAQKRKVIDYKPCQDTEAISARRAKRSQIRGQERESDTGTEERVKPKEG